MPRPPKQINLPIPSKYISEEQALAASNGAYDDHRKGWLPQEAASYLEKTGRWQITGAGPKGFLVKRVK